jgi:hypothetical protein
MRVPDGVPTILVDAELVGTAQMRLCPPYERFAQLLPSPMLASQPRLAAQSGISR